MDWPTATPLTAAILALLAMAYPIVAAIFRHKDASSKQGDSGESYSIKEMLTTHISDDARAFEQVHNDMKQGFTGVHNRMDELIKSVNGKGKQT